MYGLLRFVALLRFRSVGSLLCWQCCGSLLWFYPAVMWQWCLGVCVMCCGLASFSCSRIVFFLFFLLFFFLTFLGCLSALLFLSVIFLVR